MHLFPVFPVQRNDNAGDAAAGASMDIRSPHARRRQLQYKAIATVVAGYSITIYARFCV